MMRRNEEKNVLEVQENNMKKLILIFASLLILVGCEDGPEIKAPSYIKPHLHHLYRTVPQCFKDNAIANESYNCDLTVKVIPATGEYKGHPTFSYDGKTVGGVTMGRLKSSSRITLPVIGERFSEGALRHEVCHAYSYCGPAISGHPSNYGTCCEPWPYLKSLETNTIHCITSEVDGLIISVTVFEDSPSTLSSTNDWVIGLGYFLDAEFMDELEGK